MANTDNSYENGVQGTSYIYNQGTTPNTRAAISQRVRIITPAYGQQQEGQVGVISTFTHSQSRGVDPIRGIGFGDRVAELMPNVTEPETAEFERALLYLMNLFQAFGYAGGVDGPVRSLRHHRWPFDVEEQLVLSSLVDADLGVPNVGATAPTPFQSGIQTREYPLVTSDGHAPKGRGHTAIVTIYETCWMNSFSRSIAVDTALITESGSLTITDVHDLASVYGEFLATGNDPTIGQTGSRRFSGITREF